MSLENIKALIGCRKLDINQATAVLNIDDLPEINVSKIADAADGGAATAADLFNRALDECARDLVADLFQEVGYVRQTIEAGSTTVFPLTDLEYETNIGMVGTHMRVDYSYREHAQIYIDTVEVLCNTTGPTNITIREGDPDGSTTDTTYAITTTAGVVSSVYVDHLCSQDIVSILVDGDALEILEPGLTNYQRHHHDGCGDCSSYDDRFEGVSISGINSDNDLTSRSFGVNVVFALKCTREKIACRVKDDIARALRFRMAIYIMESAQSQRDKWSNWTTFGMDDICATLMKYDGSIEPNGRRIPGLYLKELDRIRPVIKSLVCDSPCYEHIEGWTFVIP